MYPQQNVLLSYYLQSLYSKLNKLILQHFQTFKNDPDNFDGRVYLAISGNINTFLKFYLVKVI